MDAIIPVTLRRARTTTSPAPTPAPVPKPTFPLYLLPSLRIPFTRRRRSNANPDLPQDGPSSCTSSGTSPSDTVPSLSASPTSPVSSAPDTPSLSTAPDHPRSGSRRLSHIRHDTLRCRGCATDVAFHAQIISKCFQGRYGRAYLVAPPAILPTPTCPTIPATHGPDKDPNAPRDLINTRLGPAEKRQLITGPHTVADVTCAVCRANIGWKYIDAWEPAQRYKIGKYILETKRVVQVKGWEDLELEGERGGDWRPRERGEEEGGDEGLVVFDLEDEDECDDMFAGVWDASVVARRRQMRAGGLKSWRHDASALI
ncbi:yippee-like protein [Dichotomopilus funicola]|uniref:Yippee-like protein n=1 Tax=Dichotomopilus funicola TaxID=1934379 RepID=A0AAN6ZJL5_9PEZI|nr:yippee-like protein [Dichotomopilus funicola]